MGNFLWDEEYNDMCYSQHYNGRPLSVVLTEPYDPFEPQPTSFFDDIPYIESDFASLHRHHHHHHHHQQHHHQLRQHQQHRHRSRSSGRRYKREYYSAYHPNANYHSYSFSPPPPPAVPRRAMTRVSSREVLIEKIETVTIEEQQRRPPPPLPCMVSYVRTPSPPIRQLKIRTRPSSCFDLHKESTEVHQHQQQRENRWSKFVDEQREEHFEYSYNYNKTPDRVVPIERERPPTPARIVFHDATTSTEDLYISPPKPVRPQTRDTGTTTVGLPKRPLCVTETQIIERFEKTEKVRRDSTSSAGTLTKPCNALNLSAAERKREKSRTIVRSTSKPREILVDTSGIFGFPGEFSEPTSPQAMESGPTMLSRSPFKPPDLL
ncbi:unnamed protein product [Adineta ricciae]|uniref:Uncharacterized protein n=1 Tax=Adineta ricciae TaxID=249248 RepID=A0A814MFG8_ADIRI|nr:unnamed protein product [Adineta ricciae]